MLIGTSDYTDLEQLPAVRDNLEALGRLFTDGAILGLPDRHCRIVGNPRDVSELLDPVALACEEATDTFLVYYSGHGLIDPLSGDLRLSLSGSKKDPMWIHSAVPFDEVRRIVRRNNRAKRRIIILDCCYSGRALEFMAPDQVVDDLEVAGSCILVSVTENKRALARRPDKKYTAFTGELIDLLDNGLPGGGARLDLDTVFRYLRKTMTANGWPVPDMRDRSTIGQLRLFGNRANGVAVTLPVAPPQRNRRPPATAVGVGTSSDLPQAPVSLPGVLPEFIEVPSGQSRLFMTRDLVTNDQFGAFVADAGNEVWRPGTLTQKQDYLRHWAGKDHPPKELGNHPVVYVDHAAADAYATWLGGWLAEPVRLPRLAEWELAARAGRGEDWLAEELLNDRVNYKQSHGELTAVGEFDANPYGLRDMAGQVYDMCTDEHGTPVACGGAFSSPEERLSERMPLRPAERRIDTGFRCVYKKSRLT